MTLLIPTSHGIATYHWTYLPLGRAVSTTTGFRDDTFGAGTALAAAQTHRAAAIATGAACAANQMMSSWRFEGVTTLFRDGVGNLTVGADLAPLVGTITPITNPEPVFTSYVLSKNTSFAGRAFRGRMYVPFLDLGELSVDEGGSINPTALATDAARWLAWFNAVTAANYRPYLLHTDVGAGTPVPTRVTSVLLRPVVGVQRRRRNRGA